MKTGNKIALFYTAITIGIISVVTVVFYFVATDYISRLYYSYLTEKAYATAQKHWEKDELDEEDYARIQQHYEETLPVAAEILLNADSIAEAHSVLSRYLTDEKIASLYAGNVVRFHEGKELGAAVRIMRAILSYWLCRATSTAGISSTGSAGCCCGCW